MFKPFFKNILKHYLKYIAKITLAVHHPIVIAIAGSANKTFVKEKIVEDMKNEGIDAKANPRSFNTDIGLPLAILGLPSGYNLYKNWIPAILMAPLKIFQAKLPKVLVLELGISDPGDMKHLLSIIKPKIAVITDITQRYLEGFGDMDKLSLEYEYLVKKIPTNGLVLLNNDNKKVRAFKNTAKCDVELFGLEDGADWQAVQKEEDDFGQIITIKNKNEQRDIKIDRHGRHHIYSFLISLIISEHVTKEVR